MSRPVTRPMGMLSGCMDSVQVLVRCIGCRETKWVGRDQREQPTCDKCFMPMIAEQVSA